MERTTPLLVIPPKDAPTLGLWSVSRARRQACWWRIPVPWTVYRYVAGEVLRITLLGVLAVSLLYTTLAAYQTVRSGLQLNFILPLLFKTFAYPLYFSIPISFLFGITLAVGRMVGDLEVTALKTHGIPHFQIYVPVLALGLGLAGVSFYLNGWVVPEIHYEKRNLQTYILTQLENLGSGLNRTILLPDDEGSLWVGAYQGTSLERVRVDLEAQQESRIIPAIREHLPERLPSKVTIYANEGKIDILKEQKSVVLNLRTVEIFVPEPVRTASVANEIFHQKFTITDNIAIPLSFKPRRPGIKDRTTPELLDYMARLREEVRALPRGSTAASGKPEATPKAIQSLRSASTEFHRRLAYMLSCLTFPFVAVSLSLLLNRWSRLVPFFAGNMVAIGLYYPLLMVGSSLGEHGYVPAISMALCNAALLGLGIHLTRKVLRQ